MSLEGWYRDASGAEPVMWTIADSARPGWSGRYEVTAEIRGVRVTGVDFTDLEPDSPTTALSLNGAGEVDHCDVRVNVATIFQGPGRPYGDLHGCTSTGPLLCH